MIKIISTVIQITKEFTEESPQYKIVFAGSTLQRNKLYRRIVKTYFKVFSEKYTITALTDVRNVPEEVLFDPNDSNNYLAFFIKRID